MDFSVVITTRNRAESLRFGLSALARQSYPSARFEVVVADNGSIDDTQIVIEKARIDIENLRSVVDPRPGQLVGWHRALSIATGEIVCFIDDDVQPAPGWLSALSEAYADPRVGLATGPIRLALERDEPDWLDAMRLGEPGAMTLPFLGLLDCGEAVRDIPGNFVWGSNFTVRRELLLAIGGFHPCAMPWPLIRFYGDGEIHVGRSAAQRGHRIVYHPGAAVDHDIPAARLTLDAVVRKFTTSGCARAFQTLRAARQVFAAPDADEIRAMAARYVRSPEDAPRDLLDAIATGLADGIAMQRDAFESDARFRDWVLRESYLDLDACYTHPDLLDFGAGSESDWRSGAATAAG